MAYMGRKGAAAPLTSADIPDDSITGAKIVDDAIDSEHYTAGSVDAAHVAADVATQAELDAKEEFASGTKMIFNQTAAPTGWTKVTGSGNDTALRVTTGTVGTGGSVAFETAFASQTPTASSGSVTAHELVESEIPNHRHATLGATSLSSGVDSNIIYTILDTASNNKNGLTGLTGGGGTHTHAFSNPTISAVNLDVSYVDVIIATKD